MIRPRDLVEEVILPPIDVGELTGAWRQAHFAAQAAAELGKSWAEERRDDSHSSLAWKPGADVLEGCRTKSRGLSARLKINNLRLTIDDNDGVEVAGIDCTGSTVAQLVEWVRSIGRREIGNELQASRPAPDLPDHPLGDDAVFAKPSGAHVDLSKIYSSTDRVLRNLAVVDHRFGWASCWPHHFDLASLAAVDRDGQGIAIRTIGVGVTPPDAVDSAGYWYVSGWSKEPRTDHGPSSLAHGTWRSREDMLPMAVLSMSVMESCDDESRSSRLASFLAEALSRTEEILRA